MWAINVTQLCTDTGRYNRWQPARYLEAVWAFFDNIDDAPEGERLTGTEGELRELLAMKYAVPGSSLCTKINFDKEQSVYIPGHGSPKVCYVSQHPVYAGDRWDEALEIAGRLGRILVPTKLVPYEYIPEGPVNIFNGAYGCELSRANGHVFLWFDPVRALRLLKIKARRDAGLLKQRKPAVDYYKLLMQCLERIVTEHDWAFRMPRNVCDVLDFEHPVFKVVARRAKYKEDPFTVIRWVRQCHRVYVLLHRQAFNRLGRTKCTDWHKPDMTYRQALLTFTRNERKMRECVKKCFKLNTKMWAWLFGWAKAEQLRLRLRRKAPADVHRLPAKAA